MKEEKIIMYVMERRGGWHEGTWLPGNLQCSAGRPLGGRWELSAGLKVQVLQGDSVSIYQVLSKQLLT